MSYRVLDYQRSSGIAFCLVGPTGSGKTTIAADILAQDSTIRRSISATTRQPRPGEVDGESYFFLTPEEFEQKRSRGEFFEVEQVHGNWYGTPRSYIEDCVARQQDVLLTIDLRGALTVKRLLPGNTVLMFILPPSVDELVRRLNKRAPLPEAELQRRLETAKLEMDMVFNPETHGMIDFLVRNVEYARALSTVREIIGVERIRVSRLRILEAH